MKQKYDNSIKGQIAAGGNKQREIKPAQEASSPTTALEFVLLRATIAALEERGIAIIDIPNVFVATAKNHK